MNLNNIYNYTSTPLGIVQIASTLVTAICVSLVLSAIFINFFEAKSKKYQRSEKKSIVETGSMMAFFIFFYLVITNSMGSFNVSSNFQIILSILGSLILIVGCIVNIKGRLTLGKNWANQIVIYKDQTFVKSGVFSKFRHPLYASLIWMFFGASAIYHNYLSALLNLLVFIPFMYYRAKQEEKVLIQQFKNYAVYSKVTPMFFPRIWKR